MRSDYYTPVTPDLPLTPLAPPPSAETGRRRNKRHALPLFLIFLALMAAGTGWLAWEYEAMDFPLPDAWFPYSFGDPYLPPLVAPTPAETTIRTLSPPGETTLSLREKGEAALDATEIYAAISPAIVSIEARYINGGMSEGTGVIFDTDGFFVTNAHVIVGADRVNITLSDGETYGAYLIGMDEETDLAVMKFFGRNLTAAPFGSDLDLVVGEDVYAIGNPLGSRFQGSITEGIISGIDRSLEVDGHTMTLLQTSAAINAGSSGGSLINTRGQVVGITNMKMISWYATVEGLGFAIPSTTVERVVGDLMRVGYVTGRPVLGITVRPAIIPEETQEVGLYVELVDPGSDAWEQGLRKGDVLLAANGNPLKVNNDLLTLRSGLKAGESLELTWLPGGKGTAVTAHVALMEQALLGKK